MEKINLMSGESVFYTFKEKCLSVENREGTFEAKITGYHFGNLEIGYELMVHGNYYTIAEIHERRNCRGIFKDESKRVNSFFDVTAINKRFVNS